MKLNIVVNGLYLFLKTYCEIRGSVKLERETPGVKSGLSLSFFCTTDRGFSKSAVLSTKKQSKFLTIYLHNITSIFPFFVPLRCRHRKGTFFFYFPLGVFPLPCDYTYRSDKHGEQD